MAANRHNLEGQTQATAQQVMTGEGSDGPMPLGGGSRPPIWGLQILEDSTTWQYVLRLGGIKAVHEILLDLGKIRFGKPDKATVATLTGIIDLDRLHRLGVRLLHVDSWEELLRGR